MKKQLWLCGVLVCVILLSVFVVSKMQYTPSEEDVAKEADVADEPGTSYEMSDYSVLDVQDLKDVTIEKGYLRPVAEMLNHQPGYEGMYKDLIAFLDTVSKGETSSSCYGEKKFLASKIPIYYWNPMRGQVGRTQTDVIIFSHDLKNALCYELIYENDQNISEGIEDLSSDILKTFQNSRDKKFVFFYDILVQGTASPLMLREDNMVYGSAGSGDYTVKGDYFNCIKEIAMSYNDLTNPRNLVEINID